MISRACHEKLGVTADPSATWSGRFRLFASITVCLLLWNAIAASAAVAENVAPQSRFQRTVGYLQSVSPELRVEFASIAVAKIAAAYDTEAQLAREEASSPDGDAMLKAWSVAVDRYARQMPLLLDDIELGMPVGLLLGGNEYLAISVADRTLILSHPRPSQQSAFEQEILAAFCARHSCESFLVEGSDSRPISVSRRHVKPDWHFTQQRWSCSYSGMSVQFGNEGSLSNARLICQQFMQEIVALADEFAWQRRHAVPIQWEELVIETTPHRPEHMVRLNEIGDSVLVAIPLLYGNPGLLEKITPWIQGRLAHQEQVNIELNADSLGWQ
jgi:hypothetical protein